MNSKLFRVCTGILIILQLAACKKDRTSATQQNQQQNPQPTVSKGALLFWTNNSSMLSSCGVLTVKLNTGQQTNITGYYFVAPANCVNQFGGYLYVDEGTYTYQVISNNGCIIVGGTATVIGGQCNMARIQ